jgi:hypothetical protein
MTIEAMKQALEALEKNYVLINGTERFLGLDQIKDTYYAECFDVDGINKQTNDAITALRTAIEQAEKPVAWMYVNTDGECEQIEYGLCDFDDPSIQLLYAAPRQWVGLTDEEIEDIWNKHEFRFDYYEFSLAIEAKLKEKNR